VPALYIDVQGAYLRKLDGEYLIEHKGEVTRFPSAQVDRIVLMGNVQLSTQVVASLLNDSIPVCFLSSHGSYRGRLSPAEHSNVNLRISQYTSMRDPALRLPLARWFVIGKVRNCKAFICRRLADAGIDNVALRKQLNRMMFSAGRVQNTEKLLGIEGVAARHYFDVFKALLAGTGYEWHGRNRRPPRDPINAMLSLGYTLLLNETIAACEIAGMDVFAGMLHGGDEHSEYGQPALALDLMEEFRYLVDRLVLRLVTSRAIEPDRFALNQNGACTMTPGARKKFYTEWESLLRSPVRYDHRRLSYRQIISEQVNLLARTFEHADVEYRPFMP